MNLRASILLLASIIPISIHASEMCAKFLEADEKFRLVNEKTQTFLQNAPQEEKKPYVWDVYFPALREYGEAYMDAVPGGRKSDDDLISLKLALEWRGYCPGAQFTSFWPRVFHRWQKLIYMDEDARKAAACQLLASVDRKHWELSKEEYKYDYWYANSLRGYADDHLEAYSQWISSLHGVDPEVALKAVIDFHNAECSGTHHWTDEAFDDWKNIKRRP